MRSKAAKAKPAVTTRSPGQKLIPVPVSEDFLAKVDKAMSEAGYGNRAQFIREAIYDKLQKTGVKLERALAQPPSRLGKGGRPRKKP